MTHNNVLRGAAAWEYVVDFAEGSDSYTAADAATLEAARIAMPNIEVNPDDVFTVGGPIDDGDTDMIESTEDEEEEEPPRCTPSSDCLCCVYHGPEIPDDDDDD
jgi:hypothetical protein